MSASIAIVYRVRTVGSAKFCAPALDPVLAGGCITLTPRDAATSAVSSVEQSSTTIIDSASTVCARRLRIVSAMERRFVVCGDDDGQRSTARYRKSSLFMNFSRSG